MAFTPIALPIQQLLMSNFVTDIASITNSNTLLLQAQVEDLINNLEIDTNGLTIGTDNPIVSIRTNSVIMKDTGFIFQTGTPVATTIASLVKDVNGKSVFTVDQLVINQSAGFDSSTLNTLTVNTSSNFAGTSTFAGHVINNGSFCESKESVTVNLEANSTATSASGSIILTSTSKENIFVTLKASTSPSLTPVYDGTNIISTINDITLFIDFDLNSPPDPNMIFTIHIVDFTEASGNTSILLPLQAAAVQLFIAGGQNLSTSNQIITHDGTNSVGLQTTSAIQKYGSNVSFIYIVDSNNDDRLLVKSLVGADIF